MAIEQFELIFQFCAHLAMMILVIVIATRLSRMLERPRATYGAGLPDRRKRPRLVLRDPAVVAAQLQRGGACKAA
jgi:hypothetical protein